MGRSSRKVTKRIGCAGKRYAFALLLIAFVSACYIQSIQEIAMFSDGDQFKLDLDEKDIPIPTNKDDSLLEEQFMYKHEDEESAHTVDPHTAVIDTQTNSQDNTLITQITKVQEDDLTTKVSMPTTKSCLAANSQEWLQSARYGNTPLKLSQVDYPVKGPLLENLPALLLDAQPICHPKSPLMSIGYDPSGITKGGDDEAKEVRMWKLRLMYLSLYHHQHHHAMEEATERQKLQSVQGEQECHSDMKKHNVSTFDFECKNAKYLVAEMRNSGFGSVLKRDFYNVFVAAIAMNRTVVFYNDVTNGTSFSSGKWLLSSCSRHDYQCSFQPLSGCVPTIEEIIRAPNLQEDAIESHMSGEIKGLYEESKVIRFANPSKRVLSTDSLIHVELHRIATLIIDELDPTDARVPILRKAAQEILLETDRSIQHKFLHETSDFAISFMLYIMRPTLAKGNQLKAFMDNDLPPDFDSARSFGFPIRGSDKCNQESECLQFPTYMRLLKSKWYEEGFAEKYDRESGNVTFIILVTSEMKDIMDKAYAFSNNSEYMSKFPFTPRWITNTNDIRQGNGSPGRAKLGGNTADDVITSMLSTFKLQMNAGSTIGNCCSNFHQVIMQLLQGGCGLEYNNKGQCLQSRNESLYQLCCQKKSNRVCVRERLGRMRVEFNDMNITQGEAETRVWDEL
eukprot:scaffold4446_cov272-Chaetoceros_neogracile.AAC.11